MKVNQETTDPATLLDEGKRSLGTTVIHFQPNFSSADNNAVEHLLASGTVDMDQYDRKTLHEVVSPIYGSNAPLDSVTSVS